MGISTFEQDLIGTLPYLRRYAFSLCRNESTADDLVQETMLRALSSQDRFDGANILAWVTTICRNYYLSIWRRQLKREEELTPIMEDHIYADIPAPDEAIDANESMRKLMAWVGSQENPEAVIMMTTLADEPTYDQMAAILNVPVGTVKSKVNRFRVRARNLLGRPDPTPGIKRKARSYARSAKWRALVESGELGRRIQAGHAARKARKAEKAVNVAGH